MSAVEVSDLVHEYPGRRGAPPRRALDGIGFSVAPGELFGLLGPNGGGKSTLFRILSTALPPASGRVLVLGTDLRADPGPARARLGVVFHSPSLDPRLSVRENLVHAGRLYGLRGADLARRVDDRLGRLRLLDRAGDRARDLSGGLKRRAELAKSLLHDPALVLLDEPSTGLDPAARKDLWELLLALKAAGTTVMATTHLMDEGDRCDRVGILDRGRLAALGPPEELKAELGGDSLSIEADGAAALADEISRRFGARARVYGESFLRLERADAHAFVPALVEAFPGRLRSVSLSRPSLEDVFLRRAGRRFRDAEEAA